MHTHFHFLQEVAPTQNILYMHSPAIEREMFVEIEHPVIGKMKVNGNPIKLMDNMPEISFTVYCVVHSSIYFFCISLFCTLKETVRKRSSVIIHGI